VRAEVLVGQGREASLGATKVGQALPRFGARGQDHGRAAHWLLLPAVRYDAAAGQGDHRQQDWRGTGKADA